MNLKLYSYYRSSCSYRVRIALGLKGLDYEYVPIHLVKDGGEQHLEDYRKKNPKSEVPTLVEDSFFLSQSMAIIEYLDERVPEPRLFFGDLKQKAFIRQACEIINSGIQPLQNLSVLQSLSVQFEASEGKRKQWIQKIMTQGLKSYESLIQSTASKFSFGEQVSAADLFLVPQIYNALRFEVSLDSFPHIQRVNSNCLKLEHFIKAHPKNQPDAPS